MKRKLMLFFGFDSKKQENNNHLEVINKLIDTAVYFEDKDRPQLSSIMWELVSKEALSRAEINKQK